MKQRKQRNTIFPTYDSDDDNNSKPKDYLQQQQQQQQPDDALPPPKPHKPAKFTLSRWQRSTRFIRKQFQLVRDILTNTWEYINLPTCINAERLCEVVSILIGVLSFSLFLILIIAYWKALIPVCPTAPGTFRVCNERGACENGVCRCHPLYSGPSCASTQVPGYDLSTNLECNGKGFAYPFIVTPAACITAEGNITNWGSVVCGAYVRNVQQILFTRSSSRLGEEQRLALQATIPVCTCGLGYTGVECEKSACPYAVNGICGNHGNTSVGLLNNFTNAGLGCQCVSPFLYINPDYSQYITPGDLQTLFNDYYVDVNTVYCGRLTAITNSSSPTPQNLYPSVLVYQSETLEDYKCFCSGNWKGDVCTEGQCPVNLQTDAICSGNGHPLFGSGILRNTTLSVGTNGQLCDLICEPGYTKCNNKCVYDQNPNNPLFLRSVLCDVPNTCPESSPIRCSTGQCVPIPGGFLAGNTLQPNTVNTQCINGFQTGSIDYGRINITISAYRCGNITNQESFDNCFFNTTVTEGVIGYLNNTLDQTTPIQNGFLFNNSFDLIVNFTFGGDGVDTATSSTTTPLVYYELITNASAGFSIESFDGQVKRHGGPGFASGFFTYPSKLEWIEQEGLTLNVTYLGNGLYVIGPMASWNFTGVEIFNKDYSKIKVTYKNNVYVFNTQSSSINITSWNLAAGEGYTSILVRIPINFDIQQQEIWLHSVIFNSQVTQSICLANPSYCSWNLIGGVGGQLVSNDNTKFVCADISLQIVFVQFEPCSLTFATYSAAFPESFFVWNTTVLATTEFPVSINTNIFTQVETNFTRTNYPVTISFFVAGGGGVGDEGQVVLIESPVFLTQNRLQFPCACDPGLFSQNQTALNKIWYQDIFVRNVDVNYASAGDYVLAGVYTDGEESLKRTKIQSVNALGKTLTVSDIKTNEIYAVYANNTRTLQTTELYEGNPDCDLFFTPFRCPDGSCTTASSIVSPIDVLCNCTYEPPITRCGCIDPLPSSFGCQCNSTAALCQCELPATTDFSLRLWERVNSLTVSGCNCTVYTPTVDDLTNSSITINNINANFQQFNFSIDQVPTHLVIKTSGPVDCYPTNVTFYLTSSSVLFTNISIPFDYITTTNTTSSTGTSCETWLTIFPPSWSAISNILIESPTYEIEWATLLFSTTGFSLMQIEQPIYSASSNAINAPNINTLNSSYWLSSGAISEIPVWIQVEFSKAYYIDYVTAVFYSAGSKIGNNTIPLRVYLQGAYSDQYNWFTLGSWGVYTEAGSWSETQVLVLNLTENYPIYRLIAPGGAFGLRSWQLYANQDCKCTDGSRLTLKLNSTEGLVSLQGQIDQLNFFSEHIKTSPCISIDSCLIEISPGIVRDFSNDGFCQDDTYNGFLLGRPLIEDTVSQDIFAQSFPYTLYTEFNSSFGSVQFANTSDSSLFLTPSEQLDFYFNGYISVPEGEFPYLYHWVAEDAYVFVYFFSLPAFEVILPLPLRTIPITTLTYLNETIYNFTITYYNQTFGSLLVNNLTCPAGYDTTDCGPSSRDLPVMPGYTCNVPQNLTYVASLINNPTVGFATNKTYVIPDLSSLTSQSWLAYFDKIHLRRKITKMQLDHCPRQTCPVETPYLCLNGACVEFSSHCLLLYNCPGNGCVEMTGASSQGNLVYRCACAPSFGGYDCSYGDCLPATPYDPFGTPGDAECRCGGPPPLREKPPVTEGVFTGALTLTQVDLLNNFITTGSAPKSNLDIAYLRVMPLHAPFGKIVQYQFLLPGISESVNRYQQFLISSCPPAKKGFRDEYLLLDDCVQERNPITGAIIWKLFYNPTTGLYETIEWSSITSYNDFPYLCPNGQCVHDQSFCEQSAELYVLCNNRGTCRADGSCKCAPGYRTFSITETYTASIIYPYTTIDAIPIPTIWELNWNWKTHGLNYCTAKACNETSCLAPSGCFPGTASLGFRDKLLPCPFLTGKGALCAKSYTDCNTGYNVTTQLVCSGKGIKRKKDFTDEEYCACGSPISNKVNITQISQITQLKANGWGGAYCDQYVAPTRPVQYSVWNFALDQPWRSTVTGVPLPGVYISGVRIMGPDPADRELWETCCQGYERLEYCPNTACCVNEVCTCTLASECVLPGIPKVYPCNNHGTARADGTCECDVDVAAGSGYTYDFTQFSTKGCYKLVECPDSQLSGESCNFIRACSAPEEWRHPIPYDAYLEQQWFTAGILGQGEYSNTTKLNEINTNEDDFNKQVIEGLTNVALRVLAAEAALAGCICVYPNDTISDKCCMVEGASYTYNQPYYSPYLIEGTVVNYPTLTSSDLISFVESSVNVVFTAPASFVFTLNDQINEYVISAIRLFAYKPAASLQVATLTFTSQDALGNPVSACPSTTIQVNASSLGDNLDWILGSNIGQAYYCGPFYTCLDPRSYGVEFQAQCQQDPTSRQCLDWQRVTCEQDQSLTYWPIGSQNVYQGCNRDAFSTSVYAFGCTCCEPTAVSTTSIAYRNITVTITGADLVIGQVRFYGFTSIPLDIPPGMATRGNNDICHDYKYLTQLGEDNSYYVPVDIAGGAGFLGIQFPLTKLAAKQRCMDTGGFLAVGNQLNGNTLAEYFTDLPQYCSQNLTGQPDSKCWVDAQNLLFTPETTERSQMFTPNCNTYGCYNTIEVTYMSGNKPRPAMLFATDNPDQYKTARFPGQIAFNAVGGLFLGVNITVNDPIYSTSCTVTVTGFPNNQMTKCSGSGTSGGYIQRAFTMNGNNGASNPGSSIFKYGDRVDFSALPTTPSQVNDAATCIQWLSLLSVIGLDPDVSSCCRFNSANSGTFCRGVAECIPNNPANNCGTICLPVPVFYGTLLSGGQITNALNSWSYVGTDNTGHANQCVPVFYPRSYCTVNSAGEVVVPSPMGGISFGPTPGIQDVLPQFADARSFGFEQGKYILDYIMENPCMKLVPAGAKAYKVVEVFIDVNNALDINVNGQFIPGTTLYPYRPVFVKALCLGWVSAERGYYTCNHPTDDPIPEYRLGYFKAPLSADGSLVGDKFVFLDDPLVTPYVTKCNACATGATPGYNWDTLVYKESSWLNGFPTPISNLLPLEIYIQFLRPLRAVEYVALSSLELSTDLVTQATYVYQMATINNRTVTPITNESYVTWDFNSCVIITDRIASLSVCDNTTQEHNYICMYDFTKYSAVTGYQCDECGTDTRIGKAAIPGQTCFTQFPLANSTLYPLENDIKDYYISGNLELYASKFTIPSNTTDFGNSSIIMGFPLAWEAWKNQFSNRAGQVNPKGTPSDLNWIDMCLSCNWPVDCEVQQQAIQRDPLTNAIVRYCTSREQFCDLNIQPLPNPILNNASRPPLLLNVSSDKALQNPTCGPNVILSSYAQVDKFGGAQSELTIHENILQLTPTYIQFQTISDPIWFNSGKTPYKYKFAWNLTASISGGFQINSCLGCIDNMVIEIFIYPLSLDYAYPVIRLAQNITVDFALVDDATGGAIQQYVVNFTLTSADTGVLISNGQAFPLHAFTGVGYKFYNFPSGSSVIMYNPVITDPITRQECENRIPPQWYEPKDRILSTAPINLCIITAEDQALFPNFNLGECACDLPSAGKTCDCPAVVGPFGKEVCGGYGDPIGSIVTPFGNTANVGGGTETGCYVYDPYVGVGGTQLYHYSDCKTIDLGTVAFTLITQLFGSIWNYPSIYVEAPPRSNDPVFVLQSNPGGLINDDKQDMELQCESQASELPYYFTTDELNQMVIAYESILPIFLNVIGTNSGLDWEWQVNNLPGTYLSLNDAGTDVTNVDGDPDCAIYPSVCISANFNNYAYYLNPGVSFTYSTASPSAPTKSPTLQPTTPTLSAPTTLYPTLNPTTPTKLPTASPVLNTNAFLNNGLTKEGAGASVYSILTWDIGLSRNVHVYVFEAATNIPVLCYANNQNTGCELIAQVNQLQKYYCACGTTQIVIQAGMVASEVQIFSSIDTVRTTSYDYEGI